MSEVAIEDAEAIALMPTAVLARDTQALHRHIERLWQASQRRRGLGRRAIERVAQEYGDVHLSMSHKSGRGYDVIDWRIGNLLSTPLVDAVSSGNYSWTARGLLSTGSKSERDFSVSIEQLLTIESIDSPEEPQAEVLKRICISPQEYLGVTCAMLYHPRSAGAFPAESFRLFPDDEYYEPLFVINAARKALGDNTD